MKHLVFIGAVMALIFSTGCYYPVDKDCPVHGCVHQHTRGLNPLLWEAAGNVEKTTVSPERWIRSFEPSSAEEVEQLLLHLKFWASCRGRKLPPKWSSYKPSSYQIEK